MERSIVSHLLFFSVGADPRSRCLVVKKNKSARSWLILSIWTTASLCLVYGQGLYQDHVRLNEVSIGNSFLRYLLPVSVISAFALGWIVNRLRLRFGQIGTAGGAFIISLLVLFGIWTAFVRDDEGLKQDRLELARYSSVRQAAIEEIPGSTVISDRSDKIFFPAFRVTSPMPSNLEIIKAAGMLGGLSLYVRTLDQDGMASWLEKGIFSGSSFHIGKRIALPRNNHNITMKIPRAIAFPFLALPWIACVFAVAYLAIQRFPPNGIFVVTSKMDGTSPFANPFLPSERVTPPGKQAEGWSGQRVMGDPTYFNARVPGPYDTVDIDLEFKPVHQPLLEFGVVRDATGNDLELHPMYFESLESNDWRPCSGWLCARGRIRFAVKRFEPGRNGPLGRERHNAAFARFSVRVSKNAGRTARYARNLFGSFWRPY